MNAFVCFVLITVAYVAAMVFVGQVLRARGHGSKLDALKALHQRMQGRFRSASRVWVQRTAKHRRSRANDTDDPK